MSMAIETLTERLAIVEEKLSTLMTDDKQKKNTKKESNDDSSSEKTKRTSGYLLYSSASRDETKDKLTSDGNVPKPTDVTKAPLLSGRHFPMRIAKSGMIRLRKCPLLLNPKIRSLPSPRRPVMMAHQRSLAPSPATISSKRQCVTMLFLFSKKQLEILSKP